jgi:hypothetical protein
MTPRQRPSIEPLIPGLALSLVGEVAPTSADSHGFGYRFKQLTMGFSGCMKSARFSAPGHAGLRGK